MSELLKILNADEKKIEQLTVQYTVLKKNIANETPADSAIRTDLAARIAKLKKSNAVIVNHYLGEITLTPSEIETVVNTHIKE